VILVKGLGYLSYGGAKLQDQGSEILWVAEIDHLIEPYANVRLGIGISVYNLVVVAGQIVFTPGVHTLKLQGPVVFVSEPATFSVAFGSDQNSQGESRKVQLTGIIYFHT
jgi:hypothetical protein